MHQNLQSHTVHSADGYAEIVVHPDAHDHSDERLDDSGREWGEEQSRGTEAPVEVSVVEELDCGQDVG